MVIGLRGLYDLLLDGVGVEGIRVALGVAVKVFVISIPGVAFASVVTVAVGVVDNVGAPAGAASSAAALAVTLAATWSAVLTSTGPGLRFGPGRWLGFVGWA